MGSKRRTLALASILSLAAAACSDDTATGGTNAGGANAGGANAGGTGGTNGEGGAGGTADDGGGGAGGSAPSKQVFVTSATFDGNLGGIEGADGECQALADAASVGGTWLAWMSDTVGASPTTRFTQSTDPYVLVGGAQIAADWPALIDGSIDAPIDHDETGTAIGDVSPRAWTGTSPNGTSGSPCCEDWSGTKSGAFAGSTADVDSKWSFIGGQVCTELARLYCFEQ